MLQSAFETRKPLLKSAQGALCGEKMTDRQERKHTMGDKGGKKDKNKHKKQEESKRKQKEKNKKDKQPKKIQ